MATKPPLTFRPPMETVPEGIAIDKVLRFDPLLRVPVPEIGPVTVNDLPAATSMVLAGSPIVIGRPAV
jgi:hypothetical protein